MTGVLKEKLAADQRIIDAAIECFRENGYRETTMSDIAHRSGIGRKTIFNKFETKENLLYTILEKTRDDYMGLYLEPSDLSHGDARDIVPPELEGIIGLFVKWRWLLVIAAANTAIYTMQDSRTPHPLALRNRQSRITRIEQLRKLGKVRTDMPAEYLAMHFERICDMITRDWLLRPERTDADLRDALNLAMAILVGGASAEAGTKYPVAASPVSAPGPDLGMQAR